MARHARRWVASLLVVGLGTSLGACGGDALPTVRVRFSHHRLRLDPRVAKPGRIEIVAENRTPLTHELIVVRLPGPDALLRDSRGAVFEDEIPDRALTGAISRIGPGTSEQITVRLKRGRYVVFCNRVRRTPADRVSSDFAAGEHTVLRVR